jgi:hypothetical protein
VVTIRGRLQARWETMAGSPTRVRLEGPGGGSSSLTYERVSCPVGCLPHRDGSVRQARPARVRQARRRGAQSA